MKKCRCEFSAFLITLALLLILGGCATKAPVYRCSMTMEELAEQIRSSVSFGMMMAQPAEDLEAATGVKGEYFSEIAAYLPMRIGSDTLMIGKLAENVQMEIVEEALKAHLDNLIKTFETYLPEAYEMAKQGQIVHRGDYVMLVVSPDNDKAIALFEAAIQSET